MNTNSSTAAETNVNNNVKEETVMANANTATKANDEMANFQFSGVPAPGYGYYGNQQFGAQGGYDPNFVALQGQTYTQYQDPNPQPYYAGAGFYGAPVNYTTGNATMVSKPTSIVKGANYITDEQVQGIKDSLTSESWRVDSVQSWQAGCTHKKRKGPDAGLPSGHEIEGGAPGAWHCDECQLDWILTDCDADTFDQIVNYMFNVVNTDKIKCSNIPQSLAEGVFAGIPILKLLGKFHRYAEKDYANAKAQNAATFNQSMSYGTPFGGMGFGNGMPYGNPWQAQPPMAPMGAPMGGYPGAPQYQQPYPQPVPQAAGFGQPAPSTYGANPYAAPAPSTSPLVNTNVPAAVAPPAAPAAPVAAPAAPTPYTPSNTAATAPDVTKVAGTI